jgi:hypothetical protein
MSQVIAPYMAYTLEAQFARLWIYPALAVAAISSLYVDVPVSPSSRAWLRSQLLGQHAFSGTTTIFWSQRTTGLSTSMRLKTAFLIFSKVIHDVNKLVFDLQSRQARVLSLLRAQSPAEKAATYNQCVLLQDSH